MMMKISPDQARALALVINGIRPDWDPQGIYAAIGRAKDMGSLSEIALASITAAMADSNRTPAVIPMQGGHWSSPRASSASIETECPVHELIKPAHNCRSCRSEWLATGEWPTGTRHQQASRHLEVVQEPDVRMRQAGDS